MKLTELFLSVLILLTSLASNVRGETIIIDAVPAYNWYQGCGPTAAASILGYYDLHGYDSLFNASGWDLVKLTSNVQDEISGPEHNAKYASHLGNASLARPPDTSIADFFRTSEGLPYGWSSQYYADDAFTGYASYRGYSDWDAWYEGFNSFSWDKFTTEIENGNPMMFLIDTDGNGGTDHFVPVIGYNDVTYEYAFFTTWSEDETIQFKPFQGMGNAWGIGYATYIKPGAPDPVSEPTTILLLGAGLVGLAGFGRKKFKKNQTGR